MSKHNQNSRPFGGVYNHDVIKLLRAELAQSNLILAALIDHTKITEPELKRITVEFFTKQTVDMEKK